MSRTEEIESRLRAAFAPRELIVRDDSEAHRGHSGFQEGGESHFHVVIRSDRFDGESRINRQRAVHKAIGADLMGQIHALSMEVSA